MSNKPLFRRCCCCSVGKFIMHLLCNNFDWEIHVMIDVLLFRALVQCQNDCIVTKQATVQRQTFINKENSRDQGYTSGPVKKNRLPCTAKCKICIKSAKRKWSPVLKMGTIDLLFFAPSPKWLGLAHFQTYPALPHKFKPNPHPAPTQLQTFTLQEVTPRRHTKKHSFRHNFLQLRAGCLTFGILSLLFNLLDVVLALIQIGSVSHTSAE